MSKRYDVITIDKDLAVVVEEPNREQNGFFVAFHLNSKIPVGLMKVGDMYNDNADRKAIATIGKQIEGLPLVVLPEENLEDDMLKADPDLIYLPSNEFNAALRGYKAAQQKGSYTEEQLREAIAEAYNAAIDDDEPEPFTQVMSRILQSLQPKRFPVAVEFPEDVVCKKNGAISCLCVRDGKYYENGCVRLKINPDNTIHPVNVYWS